MRLFDGSDEKDDHVRGGNDQIAAAMGAALGGRITMGSELVAIRRNATGTYALTFVQGGTTKSVTAARIVLALPFSIMRRSVDWSQAGFGPEKSRAIREVGMGTNSKLNVGFKTRCWRAPGSSGGTYADTGYQYTWEVSRAQPGTAGMPVDYTGGRIGDSFKSGTRASHARRLLAQLEPVAFGASEEEISGACHFAGEHTTQDYQGYLQGAVYSGQRAAAEVIDAIG